MTKDNHTSSSRLQNLPKALRKNLRATKKSIRNYEVIAAVNVGRMVTVALAVVEDGNATFTVGDLTPAQFSAHFSKIDLAMGVHLRENEMMKTGTLLE